MPAMQETCVWFLIQEDPLEGEMAIHSNILAWEIPWTEEPRRLQSMRSKRVRHGWSNWAGMYACLGDYYYYCFIGREIENQEGKVIPQIHIARIQNNNWNFGLQVFSHYYYLYHTGKFRSGFIIHSVLFSEYHYVFTTVPGMRWES